MQGVPAEVRQNMLDTTAARLLVKHVASAYEIAEGQSQFIFNRTAC
jgi:hypothetical protein